MKIEWRARILGPHLDVFMLVDGKEYKATLPRKKCSLRKLRQVIRKLQNMY